MEITCKRCHQTVQAENCYCPSCGMPQLLYAADAPAGQAPPEHWDDAVPDAATIKWKPALRVAMLLAVPAGVISSGLLPVGIFGVIWMAAAAAWAVVLYVRNQQPAWITSGAGARIGLVTGIMASWLGLGLGGCNLFIRRYFLHQAAQMDTVWKTSVDASLQSSQQITQQWMSGMAAADAAQLQANQANTHAWMLSPWGHAGFAVFYLAAYAVFLLLFAAAGGALGARMLVGTRRTQV